MAEENTNFGFDFDVNEAFKKSIPETNVGSVPPVEYLHGENNIQQIPQNTDVDIQKPESEQTFDFNPEKNFNILPSESDFTYKPEDPNTNDYQHALDYAMNDIDLVKATLDYFKENNKKLEAAQIKETKPNIVGPQSVDYADPNQLAKYIYQNDFKSDGFNIKDESNYDRWVAKESWGSAIAKGFDSFASRFNNTFTDYWVDYGRMANALVHFDMRKLLPDEEHMLHQNAKDYRDSMKNYVFIDEDSQDDIFSRKSISEFVGNAGFALGTISALSLELLGDAAITAVTLPAGGGGAVTFGITAAKIGALITKSALKVGLKKAGKKVAKEAVELGMEAGVTKAAMKAAKTGAMDVAKAVPKKTLISDFFTQGTNLLDKSVEELSKSTGRKAIGELSKVSKSPSIRRRTMNELHKVLSMNTESVLKSKSFSETLFNLSKEVPVLGKGIDTGHKMYLAGKAGESTTSIFGMGYRGIRRMGQEYNLAATEASFEAISTYGDTMDKMIAEQERSGDTLTADQLKEIKYWSNKASFANYGTNMAILLASNKLQFGSVFNRFTPSNKVTREMVDLITGAERKTFSVSGISKATSRMTTKVYKKGFFGTYGAARQIAKDFGTGKAVKEVGKTYVRSFGKFEVTEGLQENMQEMSNVAWLDYYSSKMSDTEISLSEAFGKGYSEQLTKQGFKTFLQGAMTGSLIRGPVKAITSITEAAQKANTRRMYDKGQDPFTKADNQLDNQINTLNEFYQNLSDGKFEKKLFNLQAQLEAAEQQRVGATNNDEYEFNNGKDNALLTSAVIAHSLGSIDAFKDAILETGNMSEEEFESTYGFKITDTKYKSPQEFTNKIANDVIKYTETLDKLHQDYKNKLVDPFDEEEGSPDAAIVSMIRNVQEEAISMIALNTLKASRTAQRAEQVLNEYNEIQGLGESSDYIYRVLTNTDMLDAEVGNLEFDIKRLSEVLKEGGLKASEVTKISNELYDKKKELELLNEWLEFYEPESSIETVTDEKTGEKSQQEITKREKFRGERFETIYKNKKGEESSKKVYFKNDSKKVKSVYRKLIKLKNKQGGIKSEVRAPNIDKGFTHIIDFMKLEKDSKNFLKASEALHEPELLKQTLEKMYDGKLKSNILHYVGMLEERIETTVIKSSLENNILTDSEKIEEAINLSKGITKVIKDSESYKNLVNIILNDELGYNNFEYIKSQISKIDELLKQEFETKLSDFTGTTIKFTEVISDEIWNDYNKNNKLPDSTVEDIAKVLFENKNNPDSLSERQTKIFNNENYTGKITVKIAQLEEQSKKSNDANIKYEDEKYTPYDKRMEKLHDSLNDLGKKTYTEYLKDNPKLSEEKKYSKILEMAKSERYGTITSDTLLNLYNAEDKLQKENELEIHDKIAYNYIIKYSQTSKYKDIIHYARRVATTNNVENLTSEMEKQMWDIKQENLGKTEPLEKELPEENPVPMPQAPIPESPNAVTPTVQKGGDDLQNLQTALDGLVTMKNAGMNEFDIKGRGVIPIDVLIEEATQSIEDYKKANNISTEEDTSKQEQGVDNTGLDNSKEALMDRVFTIKNKNGYTLDEMLTSADATRDDADANTVNHFKETLEDITPQQKADIFNLSEIMQGRKPTATVEEESEENPPIVDTGKETGKPSSTVTKEELNQAKDYDFENGWDIRYDETDKKFHVLDANGDDVKSYKKENSAIAFVNKNINHGKNIKFLNDKISELGDNVYPYTDSDIIDIVKVLEDNLIKLNIRRKSENKDKFDTIENSYHSDVYTKKVVDSFVKEFEKVDDTIEDNIIETIPISDNLTIVTGQTASDPTLITDEVSSFKSSIKNIYDSVFDSINKTKKKDSKINIEKIEKNTKFDENSIEFEILSDISDIDTSCKK